MRTPQVRYVFEPPYGGASMRLFATLDGVVNQRLADSLDQNFVLISVHDDLSKRVIVLYGVSLRLTPAGATSRRQEARLLWRHLWPFWCGRY